MTFMIGTQKYSVRFAYPDQQQTLAFLRVATGATAEGFTQWQVIGSGLALCSHLDQYNRVTGRKVALRRALEAAGWTYEKRAKVWEACWKAGMKR